MKNISQKLVVISTFFLVYYVYMNSLRKLFIPFSAITIPIILMIFLVSAFLDNKGKIVFNTKLDKASCLLWLIIASYILINNISLSNNFLNGGMIQLYVMIAFFILVNNNKKWINTWINASIIFVLIHAIATIVFYYNSNLYIKFVKTMFSGDTITDCILYYKKGFMSGLCTHFSSNGMVLGIGIIFFFEKIKNLKANNKKFLKIFYYLSMILVFYALILSSKRSPLIAAFIALIVTYIIARGKDIAKSFITLGIVCIILYTAYKVLIPIIPGLSTLVDKTSNLQESSAGILNGRSSLWKIAFDMFEKHPIIGNGYGSYSVYSKSLNAISTSAHNYYLQILSELGIVGLILYVGVFITSIIYTIKVLNKVRNNKKINETMMVCISLDIQIFVIIYNLTATALMYFYILIPYFLACAVPRVIDMQYSKRKE